MFTKDDIDERAKDFTLWQGRKLQKNNKFAYFLLRLVAPSYLNANVDAEYDEFMKENGINDDEVEEVVPYFADGFDDAVIGLTYLDSDTPKVTYSKQKMVAILVDRDSMSEEEAYAYLEFNTWGAYVGEGTPIFVDEMSDDEIDYLLM
jgi:hypothetical protein